MEPISKSTRTMVTTRSMKKTTKRGAKTYPYQQIFIFIQKNCPIP
jgi:hypothetical protein